MLRDEEIPAPERTRAGRINVRPLCVLVQGFRPYFLAGVPSAQTDKPGLPVEKPKT